MRESEIKARLAHLEEMLRLLQATLKNLPPDQRGATPRTLH